MLIRGEPLRIRITPGDLTDHRQAARFLWSPREFGTFPVARASRDLARMVDLLVSHGSPTGRRFPLRVLNSYETADGMETILKPSRDPLLFELEVFRHGRQWGRTYAARAFSDLVVDLYAAAHPDLELKDSDRP